VLDHALSSSFLPSFSPLPTMAKLAFLRGIVFIKGTSTNDVLIGKSDDEDKNLLTDRVFQCVVALTLRGGEQHSQIMGLQAAHGILQRVTAAMYEPGNFFLFSFSLLFHSPPDFYLFTIP
jgi:hypothetical protein